MGGRFSSFYVSGLERRGARVGTAARGLFLGGARIRACALRCASVKRRGALALRRAGIKRRGAPEAVCNFGLFRSRFVWFGWGFVRDVSRGHFGGLE